MTSHFGLLAEYIKKPEDFKIIEGIEDDIFRVEEIKNPGKEYAKKVFKLDNDSKLTERFNREVNLLIKSKLDGFPFAKFYGYNYDGEAFILTEYLSGGTLKSRIDKYKTDSTNKYNTEKMKILYGIIFGLNYLHKRSILHRDIKPGNIFLDKQWLPYIGDFGFSRIIKNDLKMTGDTGSLIYMAPEIMYEQEVEADFSVDIYSFAVTFVHTLAGSLSLLVDGEKIDASLIEEENFINLVQEGERFIEFDSVPENFRQCIKDCWDDDKSKRWKASDIMALLEKNFLPGVDTNDYFIYVGQLKDALRRHKVYEKEEEEEEDEKEEEEEETKEFVFNDD